MSTIAVSAHLWWQKSQKSRKTVSHFCYSHKWLQHDQRQWRTMQWQWNWQVIVRRQHDGQWINRDIEFNTWM